MSVADKAKELLGEERHRIRLHDFVSEKIREVMSLTAEDRFPVHGAWSKEEFLERLKRYEDITSDLSGIQALIGYWGTEAHRGILTLTPKRIAGDLKIVGGSTAWIALRWYPILLLIYAGGIGAVAGQRYDNLRALLQATGSEPERSGGSPTLINRTVSPLNDILDAFKIIPGHESNYAPRSEYLSKLLQPTLDDCLFLGSDYEWYFDQFEVLLALEYAEQYASERYGRVWGPVGRFGWKFHRGESSPLHRVIAEAESQGESWPPLEAGLFRGSAQRFKEIASEYRDLIVRLGWM